MELTGPFLLCSSLALSRSALSRRSEGDRGSKTKSAGRLLRKKHARDARSKLKRQHWCAAIVDMNSRSLLPQRPLSTHLCEPKKILQKNWQHQSNNQ